MFFYLCNSNEYRIIFTSLYYHFYPLLSLIILELLLSVLNKQMSSLYYIYKDREFMNILNHSTEYKKRKS